jgi:hypothetical protein
MAICDIAGCQEHYGCRLRTKGVQVSPRATPNQAQNWRPTPSVPPARNAEILYSERPGGYKSPLLKPDGTPLRRKQYEDNRHHWDSVLRSKNATNVASTLTA